MLEQVLPSPDVKLQEGFRVAVLEDLQETFGKALRFQEWCRGRQGWPSLG